MKVREKKTQTVLKAKYIRSFRPQFAKQLRHHHACNSPGMILPSGVSHSWTAASTAKGVFLFFSNIFTFPQQPCEEKSMLRKCRNSPAFYSNASCHHCSLCIFLHPGGNKSKHPITNIPKGSYQQTLPRIRLDEDVR